MKLLVKVCNINIETLTGLSMTRNGSLILLYIMIAGVTAVTERPSFSTSTETTEMDERMKENEDKLARLTKINKEMNDKIGSFIERTTGDEKYSKALNDKIVDINNISEYNEYFFNDALPRISCNEKKKMIEKMKRKARRFKRRVNALKKEKVHMNDGEFKGMVDFLGINIVGFRKILNELNFS